MSQSSKPCQNRPIIRTVASATAGDSGAGANRGDTLALVPTMGALHAGHLALVRQARRKADRVVGVHFRQSGAVCAERGFRRATPGPGKPISRRSPNSRSTLIWAPSVREMYPEGFATRIEPDGPAMAGLEDTFRPAFLRRRLRPSSPSFCSRSSRDFAMFGEKDFQQLKVVTAMARDLDIPVKIVGVPTVREKDGLAMSSRNAYLSPKRARGRAGAVSRAQGLRRAHQGRPADRRGACRRTQAKSNVRALSIDYLEARHAATLAPVAADQGRPGAAAGCGEARPHPADRQHQGLEQAQVRAVRAAAARACWQRRAPRDQDRAAHPWRRDSASPGTRDRAAAAPARILDRAPAGSGRCRPCRRTDECRECARGKESRRGSPSRSSRRREFPRRAWAPCGWCGCARAS